MRILKIISVLLLGVLALSLVYFTIQCIISAWWNIPLILLILIALYWCDVRRRSRRPLWQGLILILISVILLGWSLIPCIVDQYKDLNGGNDSITEIETGLRGPFNVPNDEHDH